MPRAKKNLAGASALIEQAQALAAEFPQKAKMPDAVARKIDQLLSSAEEALDWQLPESVKEDFAWMRVPNYKGINPMARPDVQFAGDGYSLEDSMNGGQSKLWTPNGGRLLKYNESMLDSVKGKFPKDEEWRLGYLGALALGDSRKIEEYGRYSDQKAMSTSGSVIVPSPIAAEVIDKIRAASVCQRLGARSLPMSSKTLAVPRLTGDPTISWLGENAEVTATDATMDSVTLTAQRLTGLVRVSQELFEDSNPVAVGTVLRDSFGAAMATELDRVGLKGSGTPPEPKGIRYQTGVSINSTAAAASWTVLTERIAVLLGQNVPLERIGAAANVASWGVMFSQVATGGDWIMPPYGMGADRILSTSNLAAPASGELYVGDFSELVYGIRVQFEFKVLQERYAEFGQVGFIPRIRADVAVRHGNAFALRTALSS